MSAISSSHARPLLPRRSITPRNPRRPVHQPDIEARLLHKQLYLRGLWQDNKLHFDPAGQLQNKSKTTSFTLAGVDITRVQLKPDRLQLEGSRLGILFDTAGTHLIPVENISISVAAPPAADYGPVLDAIFSDLPGLVPSMPYIWQSYATRHFTQSAPNPAIAETPRTPPKNFDPAAVTPPKVLFAPAPLFNQTARLKRIKGNVLVYLEVDTTGTPKKVRILRPLGMGLDETAALAVSQYKFKPAMENGSPVAVEMNVEVNFDIY